MKMNTPTPAYHPTPAGVPGPDDEDIFGEPLMHDPDDGLLDPRSKNMDDDSPRPWFDDEEDE